MSDSHLSRILEKRSSQHSQLVDSSSKPVNSGDTGIQVGDRVFHQKFGYGRVRTKDANKLEIAFEKAGIKKVMENFVDPV